MTTEHKTKQTNKPHKHNTQTHTYTHTKQNKINNGHNIYAYINNNDKNVNNHIKQTLYK